MFGLRHWHEEAAPGDEGAQGVIAEAAEAMALRAHDDAPGEVVQLAVGLGEVIGRLLGVQHQAHHVAHNVVDPHDRGFSVLLKVYRMPLKNIWIVGMSPVSCGFSCSSHFRASSLSGLLSAERGVQGPPHGDALAGVEGVVLG